MCLSLRSDELFRDRPASRDVDDESRYERSQVESAVEPVGEGSQVMACVLVVLQRMKSTGRWRCAWFSFRAADLRHDARRHRYGWVRYQAPQFNKRLSAGCVWAT